MQQLHPKKKIIPSCLKLTPSTLKESMPWLPRTCAYKLLAQGESLPKWHHLICGDKLQVHKSGISASNFAISENSINGEIEDYII